MLPLVFEVPVSAGIHGTLYLVTYLLHQVSSDSQFSILRVFPAKGRSWGHPRFSADFVESRNQHFLDNPNVCRGTKKFSFVLKYEGGLVSALLRGCVVWFIQQNGTKRLMQSNLLAFSRSTFFGEFDFFFFHVSHMHSLLSSLRLGTPHFPGIFGSWNNTLSPKKMKPDFGSYVRLWTK